MDLDELFYEAVPKGARVLDFGCAWGRVAFDLKSNGYDVVGFDSNEAEIAKARAATTAIQFDVADALSLPYEDGSFDACVVQAFLTTIITPEHRSRILSEAWRVLRENGVLYIGEFGQTWDNPVYKERYERDFLTTKETGTFIVTMDGTPSAAELYRAHHYTKEELLGLIREKFSVENFKDTTFTSYHGNKVKGMVVVARKVDDGFGGED